MIYSNLYQKKPIQIPTLLSIAIVGVVVFLLSAFFFTTSLTPSRASKKTAKRVEVANLSSNQVSLFWQTEQKEGGWVIYGENKKKLNTIAIDERDFQEVKEKRFSHYAILKNLRENTIYYFQFVSENHIIGDAKGEPFRFTTLSKTTQISNLKPAYGKVLNKIGNPQENAIVLLSIRNSSLLTALSKSSGEWLIPLNYILDKNTKKLKVLSKDEPVTIEIFSDDNDISRIQASLSNISPLPESVIIGKNYNFLKKDDILPATTKRQDRVEILSPKENAVIPGRNPLFRGTGIPNSEVVITVADSKRSESTKTKVDRDGVWKLNFPEIFKPGSHTVTLKAVGGDGKEQIITKRFSIAKSGEQVMGEATGSATPTLTATPSPTTPTPPVTGFSINYMMFASVILMTFGLGMLFLF